jgi:hypothetical protein
MRYASIFTGLLLLLSCENKKSEAQLFHALYGNKFLLGDDRTIEFVDSSSYVISVNDEFDQNLSYGQWKIESDVRGVFLLTQSPDDSGKMWAVNISNESIKFESSGRIFEYRKAGH